MQLTPPCRCSRGKRDHITYTAITHTAAVYPADMHVADLIGVLIDRPQHVALGANRETSFEVAEQR